MTDRQQFLFEIGTEELPPKALRSLAEALQAGVDEGLQGLSLAHGEVAVFATPRRLAVSIADLAAFQADRPIERRGPPVNVAIGADGTPGKAALKFAESCGVTFDQLGRLATGKGEYLAYSGVEQGRPAEEILPGIIQAALDSLPIPRRMRWGNHDFEFVRPVHWVVALLDDRVVPMELRRGGGPADPRSSFPLTGDTVAGQRERLCRRTGTARIRDSRPGIET